MCQTKQVSESWKSYCGRNPECFSCPSLFPRPGLLGGSPIGGGGGADVPLDIRSKLDSELASLDQQATSRQTPDSMLTLAEFLGEHGHHESAVVTYQHVLQITTDANSANTKLLVRALHGQARSLSALDRTVEADSIDPVANYIEKLASQSTK